MPDCSHSIAERVRASAAAGTPLNIVCGNSKGFLGRRAEAPDLDIREHAGIIDYQARELLLRARAGTPLEDIDRLLQRHRQMLAFEPPRFAAAASIGGTLASGLSGPRRPYAGAVRDHVLGADIINGRGERLQLGGQVVKNVAGYDLFRLMAGAMGTLGVILDVSLRVLPRPECEQTLALAATPGEAVSRMNEWAARPLPLSGTCHAGGRLYVRLSGAETAVRHAAAQIGGERIDADDAFWVSIREHTHPFFATGKPLWRLSVPPTAPLSELAGPCLIEWGGGLRWYATDAAPERVRSCTVAARGHATLFRNAGDATQVFQPLPEPLMRLHRRLKTALDPHGILNPGRLYPDL